MRTLTIIQRLCAACGGRAAATLARRAALVAAVTLPFVLGACKGSSLLSVDNPDIVTPNNLTGAAGVTTLRAGALGDFALALSGSAAGHGSTPGLIHYSGSFTDELTYAGTFPTRRQVDERRLLVNNGDLSGLYRNLHRARASAENAAAKLEPASTTATPDPRLSEMRSLTGYTYVLLGETYCSGVPVSTAAETGELTFGAPQTTTQLFDSALSWFDRALAGQAATAAEAQLARIGRGRALVNLGRFPDAATAVAGVPTAFTYVVEYSANSLRQQNGVFQLSGVDRQYSVADREGGTGLPFRSMGASRVPWTRTAGVVGQDGTTPFFLQTKYVNPNAPVSLATGIEARLIEAEAALRGNDVARFGQIHTQLRATAGLPPVDVATMSPAQRVDFHFQERAAWLWLTAQRLPDLRRLVRQYGRPAEQVFPTGAYFKGGQFGPDVNFPIPIEEQNNPNFRGKECLDRNP